VYEQRTLYGALVVTLAMLLRLINIRFIIILIIIIIIKIVIIIIIIWETPKWQHTDPVVQRQANGLGCHSPRHLCSGEPGSGQQNCQVWWTGQHAHLLPRCHRNRRHLESLDCWACPGNCQTGHINHWRTSTIHFFLFQQLSMALQRGNAVAFLNTFDSD